MLLQVGLIVSVLYTAGWLSILYDQSLVALDDVCESVNNNQSYQM